MSIFAARMEAPRARVEVIDKLRPFLKEHVPYKVAVGGRGSAKSWSIARMLILRAYTEKNHRILCCREYQNSIDESVYSILRVSIFAMGLHPWFTLQRDRIICKLTNSVFLFEGLHHNIDSIKSLEGITITWIEEAHFVSELSWLILEPSVMRTPNAEIWVSFNPLNEEDPTYIKFITNFDPHEMLVIEVNWRDNPWFPPELDRLRRRMLRNDPDSYEWVWEGRIRKISAATIFRGRYKIEPFVEPDTARPLYGADWGFGVDPNALIRMFISENERTLYITHEAYDWEVDLDDLPALWRGGTRTKTIGRMESMTTDRTESYEKLDVDWPGVPGADQWPIFADNSRPETIRYMKGKGFNVSPAEKWQGSVEDGIEHLKQYDKIIIHPRCVHTAREFRLYSYKVDKKTEKILPVIDDKHNHAMDAIRYAHDKRIQRGGSLGVWRKLGAKT